MQDFIGMAVVGAIIFGPPLASGALSVLDAHASQIAVMKAAEHAARVEHTRRTIKSWIAVPVVKKAA